MELMYATPELRGNRKIVSAAVRSAGRALQYATFQLRNERQLRELAARQDVNALDWDLTGDC